jgi:hypothetical protein
MLRPSPMDTDSVQALVRLKLKANRLPHGPAVALREIGRFATNARHCDACNEGIGPYRQAVLVMVSLEWLSVFFHVDCYEVWDAERLALAKKNSDGRDGQSTTT